MSIYNALGIQVFDESFTFNKNKIKKLNMILIFKLKHKIIIKYNFLI